MRKNSRSQKQQRSSYSDLSSPLPLYTEEEFFCSLHAGGSPFLLVLDQVQDPHNLGACLRSADAAGVSAVIVPKQRSVKITETVRHVASGAAEKVPLVQVTNLARTLSRLCEEGVQLVGTTDEAKQTLYEVELTGSLAIVMGAEGSGLRRLTKESCTHLVSIPMQGTVGCLNVSVATGICLFEAVRQRLQKGAGGGNTCCQGQRKV